MAPNLMNFPRRFRLPDREGSRGWIWIGLAALGLVVAIWFFFLRGDDADPYRTEAVGRGDIISSVSASGALEAQEAVEVGSQLSGQVTQVLVGFNDQVTRGQPLAYLDTRTYDSRLEQSRAGLLASDAALSQERAGLAEAQAQLQLAQAAYDRQQSLFERGFVAQAALDNASAELAAARAGVQTAQAQIRAAQAGIVQQRADLNATEVERGRTVISAPIDGVVIDRAVSPGQTVASGLNVQVLFTLARDLNRLSIGLLVDEADIGPVRVGQLVRFTVDAYPEQTYEGRVTQVRALPTTENNVVAYTVVAEADNPGGRLLPGMTANADIVIDRRANVLRVPSSALRFTPADAAVGDVSGQRRGFGPPGGPPGGMPGMGGGQQRRGGGMAQRVIDQLELDANQRRRVQPILEAALQQARQAGGGQTEGGGAANPARAQALNAAFDQIRPLLRPDQQTRLETLRAQLASGGRRGVVWVLRDGRPVQVPVQIGASDGAYTEILGGELREGDEVITGGGPRPDPRDRQQQQGGGVRVRM